MSTPAAEVLRGMWLELRNSAAVPEVAFVQGAIFALAHTGQLTADEAELWRRRTATCPGHDDEGGRAWCAYCGDLPSEPEDEEDD